MSRRRPGRLLHAVAQAARAHEDKLDAARRLGQHIALDLVGDDMPDGAWMAMLEELTGLDAGDIAEQFEKLDTEAAR